MLCCERDKPLTFAEEEWVGTDEQRIGTLLGEVGEHLIEIAFGGRTQDCKLDAEGARCGLRLSCLRLSDGAARPSIIKLKIPAWNPAECSKLLFEGCNIRDAFRILLLEVQKYADATGTRRLLRVREERPCGRCSYTETDKFASPHGPPLLGGSVSLAVASCSTANCACCC